jgi:hypothetical protein
MLPLVAKVNHFCSAREACRYLVQTWRAPSGHFLPVTACELLPLLNREGFFVSQTDVEALLRELAESGEICEIDPQAGYRWVPNAA